MDALRLHIRKEADDVRRCLRALDGRFEMYGELQKLAVPADVPEDLRALYVKKHFGFEHNGTQADWALWHARHGGRDCRRLSRMAPLHQLMRRMRDEGGTCRAGSRLRAGGQGARAETQTGAAKPGRLVVRSADEFEF